MSQDFDDAAERVSKSVDEVVGQASRDLDIMAEALGSKVAAESAEKSAAETAPVESTVGSNACL